MRRGKALEVHSFSGWRDSSQEEKEKSVNPVDTPLLLPVTSCWRARLSLSTTQKGKAKSSSATCSKTPQVLLVTATAHKIILDWNKTDVCLFIFVLKVMKRAFLSG